MHSTLALKETDPHDIFVIEPDVVLAARADRPVHTAPHVSAAASQSPAASDPFPGLSALDATFREAAADHGKLDGQRSELRKWAGRAAMAFGFALCSALAAAGWKHYGDSAKLLAMNLMPTFAVASLAAPQTPAPPAEQAAAPVLQAAVAEQPAAPADSSEPSPTAPAAPPAVDQSALLASMSQQIEQLKASIEQLKAGQDQMARDIARNSEAKPVVQARPADTGFRPKPPRTAAAPIHRAKPAPVHVTANPVPVAPASAPMPQTYPAAVMPPPPSYATAQPDGEPVVRPPMPLR